MRYVYPVALEQDEDGLYVASARDVPEALTEGASESQAVEEMGAALAAALAGYSLEGRPLPLPSAAKPGSTWCPWSC